MPSPFSIRGVVEGFYGRVWTWAQRRSMVEFMGAHGMNLYLYAPKMDPRHRMTWREPYTTGQLRRFGDLIELSHDGGVNFGYAIAPGLDMDYTSDEDGQTLLRKLDAFWDADCRAFAVLWDDIPSTCDARTLSAFGSLAAAQAHAVNRVGEHLAAKGQPFTLITCPTTYYGAPDRAELREFGQALAGDVHIMWTGPEVCSRELTAADAQAVSRVIGREPLYWDNYPVNDMSMSAEMHLEPLSGRSPGLSAHCTGLLSNPMTQPEASKIVLATVAAYLDDPLRYHPETAWQAAVEEVAGSKDAVYLTVLRRGLSGNCLNPRPWEPVHQGLRQALAAWRVGQSAELAPLQEELTALAEAGRHVEGGLENKALGRELRLWAREIRTWAEALLQALGPLDRRAARRLPAKTDPRDLAGAVRDMARAAYKDDIRTFGDELWGTLERTLLGHLFAGPADSGSD